VLVWRILSSSWCRFVYLSYDYGLTLWSASCFGFYGFDTATWQSYIA
jgi:hypothetical protein